jgi:hypothetical protein
VIVSLNLIDIREKHTNRMALEIILNNKKGGLYYERITYSRGNTWFLLRFLARHDYGRGVCRVTNRYTTNRLLDLYVGNHHTVDGCNTSYRSFTSEKGKVLECKLHSSCG